VNLVVVLGVYCFFENKPEVLQGYYVEDFKQFFHFRDLLVGKGPSILQLLDAIWNLSG